MLNTLRRGARYWLRTAGLASALACAEATAAPFVEWSSDDFGGIGLLQTPTARFAPDGEFRVGVSTVYPYHQLLLGLQWLPWLETGFRYADVANRRYGPESFSGSQSYKDRSIDLKLRLRAESEYGPAIALGLRDLGGTGVFASEYLVFSKGRGALDWTLGLGWGRVGARGGLRNPFTVFSDSFDDRPRTDRRGDPGLERLFGGRQIAVFGGVQWQTPLPNLSLKLELEGNDYRSEALDNNREVQTPLNLGLNYRLARVADFAIGLERGDTLMARIAIYSNFARDRGPHKWLDAPSTPVLAAQSTQGAAPAHAQAVDDAFFERLRVELDRQKIDLLALDAKLPELSLWFSHTFSNDEPRVLGRIGQTLATIAPAEFSRFTLVNLGHGAESYRVSLERAALDDAIDFRTRPASVGASAVLAAPHRQAAQEATFKAANRYPQFDWSSGPAVRQHVGGPDDFYFGQFWWRLGGSMALSPNWSFSASVGADIVNNFDGLRQPSDSRLPKVRSDIVRYLREGENNLVRLETNYLWSPAPSWHARLSAGIFEEMYGGVAGEVLYRPAYAKWALGANVNRLRQRDFDQTFAFRDYEVTTGHVTAYVDLPFHGMSARLSAGRYLAGDEGATLELSRRFATGIVAGIFATKTNVSSEDFGEGNFDKGIFLVLPLDLFFARSTRRSVPLVFRPLTRDGGQRARDGTALFDLTDKDRLDPDADWSTALR